MGIELVMETDPSFEERSGFLSNALGNLMAMSTVPEDDDFVEVEERLQVDLSPLRKIASEDDEPIWQPIEDVKALLRSLLSNIREQPDWAAGFESHLDIDKYFVDGEFQKEMESLLAYLERATIAGVERITFIGYI